MDDLVLDINVERLDLTRRLKFVAGDFVGSVPRAVAYLLKHIFHDWDDDKYVEIHSTIRDPAPTGARLFTSEYVVPGPDKPHLSKLYDVHMMVATGGRERTENEHAVLLQARGFEHETTHRNSEIPMAVVEVSAV